MLLMTTARRMPDASRTLQQQASGGLLAGGRKAGRPGSGASAAPGNSSRGSLRS